MGEEELSDAHSPPYRGRSRVTLDLWVLVLATAILMAVMVTGRRISRGEGAGLLLLYTAYIAFHFGI